ncbi:TIGR02556 family CRISPR-associated protein [Thermosipho ferrireducens]|uniref:TIGR02556 family CRISPR-associated protein n=1 Tax=Thermosipho ferrireducens TaxID=2571116 RepID=A0ABX7S6W0_9BACT|nr:TIGR02556 family CRISPR-associated protein [Thermosipho ferrireducens]QTA37934.1 TIGR02556 family CRISPR-associated protein [Thermosipho ferrireducens]
MLNGIMEVGKLLKLQNEDELIQKVKIDKKYKAVIKTNFKDEKIEFSIFKIAPGESYLDEETIKEILWVGNTKGSSPQKRFTSDDLSYLAKSIINIEKSLSESSPLKKELKTIAEKFLIFQNDVPYFNPYLLDFEKLSVSNNSMFNEFISELDSDLKSKTHDRDFNKKYHKKISDNISKLLTLNKRDKILFTVFINDHPLFTNEEYKEILRKELFGDNDESRFSQEGVCYSCGKKTLLTTDFAKFKLKFFITQKTSFASGLKSEGFIKNYALCSDCFMNFSLGETFIINRLKIKLAGVDCFLIPEFVSSFTSENLPKQLKNFSKNIIDSVNSLSDLDIYNKSFDRLSVFLKRKDLLMNFVFSKIENASVKILLMIQDVKPMWLKILLDNLRKINEEFSTELFSNSRFNFTFRNIENIFKIRGKNTSKSLILNVHKQLIGGLKIDFPLYIPIFNNVAKDLFYNDIETNLLNHIINTHAFFKYITSLNLKLNYGGEKVLENDIMEKILTIDESLEKYIRALELNEQKLALFLLGILVASIGAEQYRISSKKVILEKINFGGMPFTKLKSFAIQIFEKLNQYKILTWENENLYAVAKELLDKSEKEWKLSPAENVYYILSGYAWKTQRIMSFANSNKKEEDDK